MRYCLYHSSCFGYSTNASNYSCNNQYSYHYYYNNLYSVDTAEGIANKLIEDPKDGSIIGVSYKKSTNNTTNNPAKPSTDDVDHTTSNNSTKTDSQNNQDSASDIVVCSYLCRIASLTNLCNIIYRYSFQTISLTSLLSIL